MNVPRRIQSIRESKGLSRDDLARRLPRRANRPRATRVWVWRIETGEIELLVKDLPRFARALECSVVELVS